MSTTLDPDRHRGTVALVTGAASGMGRAIALRLGAEGAVVHGVDRDAAGLAAVTAEVTGAGGTMVPHEADLASVEACRAAVAAAVDFSGGLDVLGNVAGISWMRNVADVTEADWDRIHAVNLKAVFFLCQAALPHVLEREGSIVNIASNAGFMGQAYFVPYCATKGAVVNMTRALAMEFVKHPVRINAIAPGGTDTPMNEGFELARDVDVSLMRPYQGFRPFAPPEQVAALFSFLIGAEAGNIHGSIVNADSGLTAA